MNNKFNKAVSNILDWVFYISGYTFTLFLVDLIFNAFEVDNVIYYFIASILISILNKTIKPIIFKYTLSITGLTFGLFYFVINFLMLEIVDLVLLRHFDIYGIFWGIFIAFVISIVNFLVDEIIIRPIIRSCDSDD